MMFCTNCGHKLPSKDLKFCPECGQPLPVIPVPPTNEEPPPQPPKQPASKGKRLLITIGLLFVVGLGAIYAYFSQQFDSTKQKQAFYDSIFEQNYQMYDYIQLPKDVVYDKDEYLNSIQTELREIDDLDTHIMESTKEKLPIKNENGDLLGTLTFEPHGGLFKKLVFQPNVITVHLMSMDDDLLFHFGGEEIPLKKGEKQTFKTVLNISVPAKVTHEEGLIKEGHFEITVFPQEANEVVEDVVTAEDFMHPLGSNNIDATLYNGDTSLEKTIRELDGELLYYTQDTLDELNARVQVDGKTYQAKNEEDFSGLFQFEDAAKGDSNIEPDVSEEELHDFLSS